MFSPLKSGEAKRGGEGSGVFSCCFGRLESMCCNKLRSSHLHPRFLSFRDSKLFVVVDLLGIHHAAVEELSLSPSLSGPSEEDESDGLGCAVLLGQPWSLDGTCLQFSLTVTRPTDL